MLTPTAPVEDDLISPMLLVPVHCLPRRVFFPAQPILIAVDPESQIFVAARSEAEVVSGTLH